MRRKAPASSVSCLKILRKKSGIEGKRYTVVYHDLDHLAGTWDTKDLAEFRKNVKDFEKTDEKMWK